MSDVLEEIFLAGKRAAPGNAAFALERYLEHPDRIRCSLATAADGRILGFQSLKHARAGNPYGTPTGWGIIGTHVRPSAGRSGIGRSLFASSLEAAHMAGLRKIEAYIGANNDAALAYYEALGFRTWRRSDGIVCKAFDV